MHPALPRLRACAWVVVCLIAAVGLHLGSAQPMLALGQSAVQHDAHAAITGSAVRPQGQVAPAHPAQLRQPGHHLDLGVVAGNVHAGPADRACDRVSSPLSTNSTTTDSTNCERAPPTV